VDVVALITQARLEHEFGASRTRICFQRIHQVQFATETMQRGFRDIGVPRLAKAGPRSLLLGWPRRRAASRRSPSLTML
jgi:hypothetical protein